MGPDTLVPITFLLMPVLIVSAIFYFGHKNKKEILETIRVAASNGTELTPDVIKALGMPEGRRVKYIDIRWGIVLLAIALAFMAIGWIISATVDEIVLVTIFSSIAAMPGFVGLALIAMGIFMRDKSALE